MYKSIIKTLVLPILAISFIGCNDVVDDKSASEKVGADKKISKDVLVDEVKNTKLNLDKPLSKEDPVTDVSKSVMEGIAPYATKSIWGDSAISHFSSSTKQFYVAPLCLGDETNETVCGKSVNLGTKDSPWDFYSVTKGEHSISPNSVVWMIKGEYNNPENNASTIVPYKILVSGATDKPIHFRAQNGDFNAVKINAGINVAGSWVWLWDVEMTYIRQVGEPDMFDFFGNIVDDWRPHNTSKTYYFDTSGYSALDETATKRLEPNITEAVDHCKVINTRAHKLSEGMSAWSIASNLEIYGNVIYDNGWTDKDRSHGHALYQQNATGTTRLISDNIIAGHMGHGLQIYSTIVKKTFDFSVIGNIFFAAREVEDGNGIYIGSVDSRNIKFNENFISSYALKYPYLIFENDLYVNGEKYDANGDRYYKTPSDRECSNNLYYSAYASEDFDCDEDKSNTHYNYYNGQFALNEIKSYIRPNKYDARRANLVVLNPNREDTVTIDLGIFAKKGDKVKIYNSLDMSTPLEEGIYNGSYANLHWPDTSWSLVRYVDEPDKNIKKEFWAFVIINLGQ